MEGFVPVDGLVSLKSSSLQLPGEKRQQGFVVVNHQDFHSSSAKNSFSSSASCLPKSNMGHFWLMHCMFRHTISVTCASVILCCDLWPSPSMSAKIKSASSVRLVWSRLGKVIFKYARVKATRRSPDVNSRLG